MRLRRLAAIGVKREPLAPPAFVRHARRQAQRAIAQFQPAAVAVVHGRGAAAVPRIFVGRRRAVGALVRRQPALRVEGPLLAQAVGPRMRRGAVVPVVFPGLLAPVGMRQPHQVAAPVVLAAHHLALGRAHQRRLVPVVVAVPRLAAQGVHLEVHQPVVVEVIPLCGTRAGVVHLVVAVLVFHAPLLNAPVARGAHHAPPPVVVPSVGHAVADAPVVPPVAVQSVGEGEPLVIGEERQVISIMTKFFVVDGTFCTYFLQNHRTPFSTDNGLCHKFEINRRIVLVQFVETASN